MSCFVIFVVPKVAATVPVYVDVDDRAQAKVTARYQVSSIPTVLVLDANGTITRQRSTMSISQTLAFLSINSQ